MFSVGRLKHIGTFTKCARLRNLINPNNIEIFVIIVVKSVRNSLLFHLISRNLKRVHEKAGRLLDLVFL